MMYHLYFESFLKQLKTELGYSIDIAKLKQLTDWFHHANWKEEFLPLARLYAFCRVLFLQNIADKPRFDALYTQYVLAELKKEKSLVEAQYLAQQTSSTVDKSTVTHSNIDPATKNVEQEDTVAAMAVNTPDEPEPPDEDPTALFTGQQQYLNLSLPIIEPDLSPAVASGSSGSQYLLTDSYLPITTRDMIHAWRHLRKKGRFRISNRLNIEATVRQVAKEGLLLEPVFQREVFNSEGLLLLLIDRKGSMTPFHSFTDKLIQTAIRQGGHRRALVYYFYNCPVSFVYKNPDLTAPLALETLYSMIDPSQTNALIISDGGAAKGNFNPQRVEQTKTFLLGDPARPDALPGLLKAANFVAWANPMPVHRWRNTSVAPVAFDKNYGIEMQSLMDNGFAGLVRSMDALMGR